MRSPLLAVAASAVLAACLPRVRAPQPARALDREGELYVYLEPIVDPSSRLSFSPAGLAAVAADGTPVPLALSLHEVSAPLLQSQRLLASGRLPPGTYAGLLLQVSKATLAAAGGATDLLVPKEPVRIDAGFSVAIGRATVLTLGLRRIDAPEEDFAFAPTFSSTERTPSSTRIEVAGYTTNTTAANLTVLDRRRREVIAVIPTGAQPRGIAVDARAARAYVALEGEDRIDVIDLQTGERVTQIVLQPGDRPREVVLTPDARTLLVTNTGSDSVAFVNVDSAVESQRVPVAQEPRSLLLDRGGRRAYAFGARSSAITVVDVANRSAVTTLPLEAEPLRGQLSRDGSRLYVVHRGSPYLSVLSAPDLALLRRVHVGLGASAVEVDPRTDRIYVGRDDQARVEIVDPFALVPVDAVEVSGPVAFLEIDELENTLLALTTERTVAIVDLSARRTVAVLDVGDGAYQIAVVR